MGPVRVISRPHSAPAKASIIYTSVSCALYPCMSNYVVELKNGVLHEDIITTNPALQDSKGLISNYTAF
jgi:hypothetical protein